MTTLLWILLVIASFLSGWAVGEIVQFRKDLNTLDECAETIIKELDKWDTKK